MSAGAQPARRLGLIAGGGVLPLRVAEAWEAGGRPVHVLLIEGWADAAGLNRYPHERAGLGEIGRMIAAFRAAGCEAVCFAGMVKRPNFGALKLDMTGAALLPKALAAAVKGDDALMRVVVEAFEKAGFAVIGPHEAADGLTATEGPLGAVSPQAWDLADIRRGFEVARALGGFDIGQGVVVCAGLILATEAQEGTDAMLARILELPAEIRGAPEGRRGVLVKAPKPGQERRIDLPTIGAATVRGAARAGLAGIAVEAGGALIVDREAVAAEADATGLFVVGVPLAAAASEDA